MANLFTYQDIYDAYRKLKTSIYYTSGSLFLREKLARFETEVFNDCADKESFKRQFQDFFDSFLRFLNSDKPLEELLSEIGPVNYRVMPKTLSPDAPAVPEQGHFITNDPQHDKIPVEKCNYIIDAPIHVHLISVLWLMFVGRRFSHLISDDNYAYRLSLCDDDIPTIHLNEEDKMQLSSGLMLFEPYFKGYQEWRDNGILEVNKAFDNKENAVLLSLDIKRYFYSVRVNVTDLFKPYTGEKHLSSKEQRLCNLLQAIHECYDRLFTTAILGNNTKKRGKSGQLRVALPVGLLSSGFLGNLILKPFDDYIRNQITPAYYGRYVDDILFVFAGKKLTIEKPDDRSPIDAFISGHLVNHNPLLGKTDREDKALFSRHPSTDGDRVSYRITVGHSTLDIQLEKVIMEYFKHSESRAAINKFTKQLEKNRSEFRYLPIENIVDTEFDDEAFRLEYSESINKLRSVQGISEDKYGASKYLAQKIFLSSLPFDNSADKSRRSESARQILTYFKGRVSILMSSLWEKVATYFALNDDLPHLLQFYRQAKEAVGLIELSEAVDEHVAITCGDKLARLKADLTKELEVGIAMALSLSPKLVDDDKWRQTLPEDILTAVNDIRCSYLFRHNCQYLKAFCYTVNLKSDTPIVGKNLLGGIVGQIDMDRAPYLSPIFLKPNDIALVMVYYNLNMPEPETTALINGEEFEKKCYDFNYKWRHLFIDWTPDRKPNLPLYATQKATDPRLTYIKFSDRQSSPRHTPTKRVGIVNWKVRHADLKACLDEKPDKSTDRRRALFEVLNYAARKRVELLVFPETSIPVEWLPLLVDQAAKNNYAIVGGLEYFITTRTVAANNDTRPASPKHGRIVRNYSFSIFPVDTKFYTTAIPVLRRKNYYAPGEEQFITGYHFEVPPPRCEYHLFHWRSVYFSVYNCFELSNISDRALLKSKVDFLVAIEFNRDVSYFSNIAESWARDLHCFIIQANSSDFGDTRLVQPTREVTRDIMKVKGGDHPLVLVTAININDLREYQRTSTTYQLNLVNPPYFKPTPASFEWSWVERRIANEPVTSWE